MTVGNIAFSHDKFAALIRQFSTDVPRLLLQHPQTAALAVEIKDLQLSEIFEQRFTVAVVGQMRVGKSTLLNALIGRDLAVTGVVETTATINWFRYADGNPTDMFRVHWRDGTSNSFPINEINEWIELKDNAKKTSHIDFYAETDFLKTANIIDTPGTRSVIDEHTASTDGLLAEQLENETLAYGGRADAIIYVLNPLARKTDDDFLKLFGTKTRLSGSSAANSIAVVQRWEHLTPDPFINIQSKCVDISNQLDGKVSQVIPTSSLLARLSDTVPEHIWGLFIALIRESEQQALEKALKTSSFFTRKDEGLSLPPKDREAISSAIPWHAISICAHIIECNPECTESSLASLVYKKSGVGGLLRVLKDHFFSRSRFIKANTIFAKGMAPCKVAKGILAEIKEEQTQLLSHGEELLQETGILNHNRMTDFLTEANQLCRSEIQRANDSLVDLEELMFQANRSFRSFDEDNKAIVNLDDPNIKFSAEDKSELRRLFGLNGIEPFHRLNTASDTSAKELMTETALASEKWLKMQTSMLGEEEKLVRLAVGRLDDLLDFLKVEDVK